jgi:hypothetical protein
VALCWPGAYSRLCSLPISGAGARGYLSTLLVSDIFLFLAVIVMDAQISSCSAPQRDLLPIALLYEKHARSSSTHGVMRCASNDDVHCFVFVRSKLLVIYPLHRIFTIWKVRGDGLFVIVAGMLFLP